MWKTSPAPRLIALVCLVALLAVGVARLVGPGEARAAGTAPAPAGSDLSRLLGQLLLVGFEGAEPDAPGTRAMLEHARAGRIGGVLLLQRNIRAAVQVRRLTAAIAALDTRHPVLIAVDQEGGAVQRLGPAAGFTAIPSARTVGRQGLAEAEDFYDTMARELSGAGVNMNLGPVVDLDLVPEGGVIGGLQRSFHRDPKAVVARARIFIEAHRRAGILTVPKHFPGHGNTAVDSHRRVPDISASWRDTELVPYRRLLGPDRVAAVMTAHVAHPDFSDRHGLPASLSRATTRWLREALGFDGVAVTDDLHMAAVTKAVGSDEEAAVRALVAGADLLIFSAHPRFDPTLVDRLHRALAAAVASGRLSPERVREAHGRVVAMKRGLGR